MSGHLASSKLTGGLPEDCVNGRMKGISIHILEPGHVGDIGFGIIHELKNE